MIETGVTLVRPTGRVLEENPQYIEIEIPDTDLEGNSKPLITYARPLYQFGYMGAPSEEFLTKYKDEISIAIIHEQGNPDSLLWMGYTFNDGKQTDEPANFPKTSIFRTTNFFIQVDDEAQEMVITHRPDTEFQQTFKLDAEFSTLGKAYADKELALIGETTRDFLLDLIGAIKGMKFSTTSGSTINLLTLPEFIILEQKIDEILSKSVKLD